MRLLFCDGNRTLDGRYEDVCRRRLPQKSIQSASAISCKVINILTIYYLNKGKQTIHLIPILSALIVLLTIDVLLKSSYQ
jgi:hypothetical protein